MLTQRFFFALALASAGLASCQNADKNDVPPTPTCISGVVLGDRCWDGVLIQVDSQFPIGKSIQPFTAPDSLGNTNVVAAANFADLGTLNKRGQRVYFTYDPKAGEQPVQRFCPANGAPFPVPHLRLTSVYGVHCDIPNR
ncbi:hypothetical protein [Hymenobacter properus]|uniref:Lipoprotein n=1 Tax=Hymenobacter properus TaxID=2791026 RepID=A0A931FK27_9BACT|nr:hypothetical protein [Hymenobacter properus]MBF9142573.1 hypothetical protein [Hymenobacter properus]MBR7721380.1 hypothetical protein [Microvirga sp. SRT04]